MRTKEQYDAKTRPTVQPQLFPQVYNVIVCDYNSKRNDQSFPAAFGCK